MSKLPKCKHLSGDLPPVKSLSPSQLPVPVGRSTSTPVSFISPVEVATPRLRKKAQPQLRQRTATQTSPSSTPKRSNIRRHAEPTSSSHLSPGIGDKGRSTTRVRNTAPKCFRIANVPLNWDENMLLAALKTFDPIIENQNPQLSLYPCLNSTETQTALLNLGTCTEYFEQLKPDDFNHVKALDKIDLVIDSHFDNLTPLNLPARDVVAELVLLCLAFNSC